MANHQRRALQEQTRELLLYAPACRKDEFVNAIGYLIRRLDENTGPENFLRHAFHLRVGSPEWETLEAGFRAAFDVKVSDEPRRKQNRFNDCDQPIGGQPRDSSSAFQNEPDTDFSLPHNSQWAAQLITGCDSIKARADRDASIERSGDRRRVRAQGPSQLAEKIAGRTITRSHACGSRNSPSARATHSHRHGRRRQNRCGVRSGGVGSG
jgi:hypothetical protein